MPLGPKADNPPRFFFGWVMLGVACLATVATSPGQSFLVGIFNEPIQQSAGLDATQISLAYLIATVSAALPLTLVGKASDRFGPRVTTGVVSAGLALVCFLMPLALNFWLVLIGFFLLRFLGQGALSVLAGHVVALWFERRIGRAEAVRHASMSLAVVALPVPIAWLVASRIGWQGTYAILGLLVALLTLPAVLLFYRNKPEDIGQLLDNGPAKAKREPAPDPVVDEPEDPAPKSAYERTDASFTLRQAMVTRAFWTLIGVGVCSGLVGTALIFHMEALARAGGAAGELAVGVSVGEVSQGAEVPSAADGSADADLEKDAAIVVTTNTAKTLAAAVLIPWGIASGLGAPIFGVLADKLRPRTLLVCSPALLLVTIALFLAATLLDQRWAFFAGMGVFGVSQALAIAATGPAIARWFGRAHHGAIRGFMGSAMVVGTACGPILLGLSLDHAGGPLVALLVFALMTLPLVPTAFTVGPPPAPGSDTLPEEGSPAGNDESANPDEEEADEGKDPA